MTVTLDQAQMLAELARACRPTGARRWDTPGILAAIKQVANRDLATVVMAVIRAASDRDVDSPGVIPSAGSHWAESAAVATYAPQIIAPENRCGICSKDRDRCQRDRVADDDHVFDDGRRVPPVDVHRTVAALKDELAPIAPRPMPKTLDERLAAIPAEKRDPGTEHIRAQIRGEVGTGAGEDATGQDTGTAWVTRSVDCPEAPAQAHLPAGIEHVRQQLAKESSQ